MHPMTLPFVCADRSEEKNVLDITVVAEWRGLDDNVL